MANRSGGPHVGSALSCTDIIATLYHGVLRLDPWEERDIFILSKAHASMALYATLAARGIMPRDRLETYCCAGGLPAHLDLQTGHGVECSAGSSVTASILASAWLPDSRHGIGQGESLPCSVTANLRKGPVWEGALFCPSLGLDNVTAIIDYNNLQGYGRPGDLQLRTACRKNGLLSTGT